MMFLADESCDSILTAALRADGHDVIAVAETRPGADDTTVIALALDLQRILITEDKDFGQIVYASGHGHHGVILLRYPFPVRHHMAVSLADLIRTRGAALATSFTVVEPGRIRILPA